MANIEYEQDVLAWANEQASLIRAGQFDQLDIEHIAEEIEDVGKSEQRELAHRITILLAYLLKWQYQPERRGNSWQTTIKVQRRSIKRRIKRTPSLQPMLSDPDWQEEIWADTIAQAAQETELDCFPSACPWSLEQVLDQNWLPEYS